MVERGIAVLRLHPHRKAVVAGTASDHMNQAVVDIRSHIAVAASLSVDSVSAKRAQEG